MNGVWRGVDLDGTLAEYKEWKGVNHIGKPIPKMLERVKKWIANGEQVRIMTARVCYQEDGGHRVAEQFIQAWCQVHIGHILPVTNKKDYQMIELWDDRAVQVVPNTGVRVDGKDV